MSGKYAIALTIVKSELNCIEVGIMPRDYVVSENKICVKSLGFHFANGKLHDTKGLRDKQTTSWREAQEPAAPGTVGTI